MKEKKYDFIILSDIRTGSHLLGDALNSHPQIACEGEEKDNGKIIYKKAQASHITGKLFKYAEYYKKEKTFPETKKIIHLTRNPKDVALSDIMNHTDKAENKFHISHFFGGEKEQHFKFNQENIDAKILHYKRLLNWFSKKIKKYPCLVVRYENLTYNKEVKQIVESEAKRILDFLELEYYPLKTRLVKSKRIYKIQK